MIKCLRRTECLPAVVVRCITVDDAGTIPNLWVQRKPEHDDGESEIAQSVAFYDSSSADLSTRKKCE